MSSAQPLNYERRAEAKADSDALRDYRPEEVLAELTKAVRARGKQKPVLSLSALEQYQSSSPAEKIVETPLPPLISRELGRLFTQNTTFYDDDVEAILDEDPVVSALLSLPASPERMVAFRARRTVVVLTLLALQQSARESSGGTLDAVA